MSLSKRGKIWYAEIRYAGQRRREAVGPRKEEAAAVLAKWKEEIRHGRFPTLRRVQPILFKDHAAEVLEKHYSQKRSYEWAKMIIEVHLVPFFGDIFLGSITPAKIEEYRAMRLAAVSHLNRRISRGTVNNERSLLSKIMSLAVKWERVGMNPVRAVEKYETPQGRLRFLSHEEADRLIAKAGDHLKPILVTALETGGRLSEVLGLRWADVDFDRGILHFDQTNTKNARRREIPMTPLLVATLREHSRVRGIRGDAREFVFTWVRKRMQDVGTSFERARIAAGLGPDVTFHTLRHTFASWFAMQPGNDLNLLRDLLGHQDLKMTMRYAHLSPTYRRSAVPLMGRQGGQAPAAAGEKGGSRRRQRRG